MDIVEQDSLSLDYVMLTLSSCNDVRCEYFSEYPELKIRRLAQTATFDLTNQGIYGYALCIYKEPVWTTEKIRGKDSASRQVLSEYIKSTLNEYYSKVWRQNK